MRIARHKTARARTDYSRPVRLAREWGVLSNEHSFFDFGCGHGTDVELLSAEGFLASGWDPVHNPEADVVEADVVNLGYVVNVIECAQERDEVLRRAWQLAGSVLLVAARLDAEAQESEFRAFNDGCLTSRGTFQKFYSQQELREWIETTLQVETLTAAPGVFFAFKDANVRDEFEARSYRRRVALPSVRLSDVLYEQHQESLKPLMDFMADRGRLPDSHELDAGELDQVFGSVRRAFAVVRRVTGPEQWDEITDKRAVDLLLYVALSHFGKRSRFSQLPRDIQLDVKAFHGSYRRACQLADELMYSAGDLSKVSNACESAPCGMLTDEALYVHVSAVADLDPVLRVYEGCARRYVGSVEGATLVKMHRHKPKVSYLSYPEFDSIAHPPLHGALVVPLNTFEVKYWDYSKDPNPPLLHRKEQFVAGDYPHREKFTRLSRQESDWGLVDGEHRFLKRRDWEGLLRMYGVCIRGHRLERANGSMKP